jgi:hypothetical protein
MRNYKYVVYPRYMMSKNDKQEHYINSQQLMHLYNVNPRECIFDYDISSLKSIRESDYSKLIHLYPRYDGNYSLYD